MITRLLFSPRRRSASANSNTNIEQKSVRNLCSEIARTGDVSSCPYKDKCRFSHDLEAFKAQKPTDLEGQYTFFKSGGACPYGLGCRFSSTHEDGVPSANLNGPKIIPM
ncbi:hypothetical protein GLYMA_07G116066v4 [Glycine max]|nr:hypothetical protein GLYMA_07G116066v4 [Glycine max]KAH1086431.1 hypothetical protein GYH30_018105 [Glycine max]